MRLLASHLAEVLILCLQFYVEDGIKTVRLETMNFLSSLICFGSDLYSILTDLHWRFLFLFAVTVSFDILTVYIEIAVFVIMCISAIAFEVGLLLPKVIHINFDTLSNLGHSNDMFVMNVAPLQAHTPTLAWF